MRTLNTRMKRLEEQIGDGMKLSDLTDEELNALMERKELEMFGRKLTPEERKELMRELLKQDR